MLRSKLSRKFEKEPINLPPPPIFQDDDDDCNLKEHDANITTGAERAFKTLEPRTSKLKEGLDMDKTVIVASKQRNTLINHFINLENLERKFMQA